MLQHTSSEVTVITFIAGFTVLARAIAWLIPIWLFAFSFLLHSMTTLLQFGVYLMIVYFVFLNYVKPYKI